MKYRERGGQRKRKKKEKGKKELFSSFSLQNASNGLGWDGAKPRSQKFNPNLSGGWEESTLLPQKGLVGRKLVKN